MNGISFFFVGYNEAFFEKGGIKKMDVTVHG